MYEEESTGKIPHVYWRVLEIPMLFSESIGKIHVVQRKLYYGMFRHHHVVALPNPESVADYTQTFNNAGVYVQRIRIPAPHDSTVV